MIYATLKANKEADIDIVNWYDETICNIAFLFQDKYGKYDWDEVSWEQVHEDFSEKEIKQAVWKAIKQEAKNGILVRVRDMFVEIDWIGDIVQLTKEGKLSASDLKMIQKEAKSKKREDEHLLWGDLDGFESIDDLLDEFYPCHYDMEGKCTNCHNCD